MGLIEDSADERVAASSTALPNVLLAVGIDVLLEQAAQHRLGIAEVLSATLEERPP
jgi:hypothetical protein